MEEECGLTTRWWVSVQEEQEEEPDDFHLCGRMTVCELVCTLKGSEMPKKTFNQRQTQSFYLLFSLQTHKEIMLDVLFVCHPSLFFCLVPDDGGARWYLKNVLKILKANY